MRLLICSALLVAACSTSLSGQTPASPAPTNTPPDRTTTRAWTHLATLSADAIKRAAANSAAVPAELQALPELSFQEFFGPIGPGGLEYSEKIHVLAGRRVRVRGFMVQQAVRAPGLFLFTAWPVKVDTRGDCNENDTPPAMLHVLVPGAGRILPFVPGPRVLSGVLEIGARAEADDRISVARLILDENARTALFGPPAAPVAAK